MIDPSKPPLIVVEGSKIIKYEFHTKFVRCFVWQDDWFDYTDLQVDIEDVLKGVDEVFMRIDLRASNRERQVKALEAAGVVESSPDRNSS